MLIIRFLAKRLNIQFDTKYIIGKIHKFIDLGIPIQAFVRSSMELSLFLNIYSLDLNSHSSTDHIIAFIILVYSVVFLFLIINANYNYNPNS